PDEYAEEVLYPHCFQPAHRLHHDMMALAAEHTSDHEDHLGIGGCAPGVPHGFDALRRYVRRVEPLNIDADRHDCNALPGRGVPGVDQFCDLIAHSHNALTADHDTVVETLEHILLAEAFVQIGRAHV